MRLPYAAQHSLASRCRTGRAHDVLADVADCTLRTSALVAGDLLPPGGLCCQGAWCLVPAPSCTVLLSKRLSHPSSLARHPTHHLYRVWLLNSWDLGSDSFSGQGSLCTLIALRATTDRPASTVTQPLGKASLPLYLCSFTPRIPRLLTLPLPLPPPPTAHDNCRFHPCPCPCCIVAAQKLSSLAR